MTTRRTTTKGCEGPRGGTTRSGGAPQAGAAWVAGLAIACGGPTPPPAAPPQSGVTSGAVLLGAPKEPAPVPPLRSNQVGYLPQFAKLATMANADRASAVWQLEDASGKVLASGNTKPFGDDRDSGERLHQIDFSSYRTVGDSLRLRVGSETSTAFAVSPNVYEALARDAFKYFYHNRSGIAIEMPYAGSSQWTRPAGHLSDRAVACAAAAGCDHTLDVSGGWYDAGDHGKYVVNAGISVWTLQNLYERMAHRAAPELERFGDGELGIPEGGNQFPDLLDEARWEVEWMLRMQVPEGKTHEGMVHHKVHDETWTAIGQRPPTDTAEIKMKRFLRPVSTAATLNLAAAAAQAARIWKGLDAAFAERCLTAAERAYVAARANPRVLAPDSDSIGGGSYSDARVEDEFYWAVAELYITTGKTEYGDAMAKSPFHHHVGAGSSPGSEDDKTPMTWQSVAALGTISLAIVPNPLGEGELRKDRAEIRRLAEKYLAFRDRQGYRIPFESFDGKFPWGSNSFILNNALLLGVANDLGPDRRYVDGMIDAMNYILGNNPMGMSYVSGYGTRSLKTPHHRFWSHVVNPQNPPAPPGAVSGGPNSSLQDPTVRDAGLLGCRPMKCYLDDIDAWSVNEVTINWNAPLVWVAAYLDQQARAAPPGQRR
ncbi:MAG: glycoside hydrolase family 9 protein [Polyangiaceae bacterium]|nr:glycoside hydrolase family 9 protein [Polyangiaceae bacterium]